MGTLLLVHAHPDDESASTGGAIMKAKANGHRVVLITATGGEASEIHNMDEVTSRPRLAEIRAAELQAAAKILWIDRLELLGYRDSGMAGIADNDTAAPSSSSAKDALMTLLTRGDYITDWCGGRPPKELTQLGLARANGTGKEEPKEFDHRVGPPIDARSRGGAQTFALLGPWAKRCWC